MSNEINDDIIKDIEELESELTDKYSEEPIPEPEDKAQKVEEIIETPASLTPGKITKEGVISKIMQLQELVKGYEIRPITQYRRLKLEELKEILAELTNMGAKQYLGDEEPDDDSLYDDSQDEDFLNEDKNSGLRPTNRRRFEIPGDKILFNLNLMICQFLEVASVKVEDKLGTNLYGLTDDVLENREALEDCLGQIYAENEEWLSPMLSGTNRYLMIMFGLSTKRMISNKKKPHEYNPQPPSD